MMEDQAVILRQELPRLIEAAKSLEASVLVMLLTTVDEELRKRDAERRTRQDCEPTTHS
jgi:hypothetical protein